MTALEIELPVSETRSGGGIRRAILRRPSPAALRRNPRAADNEFKILQIAHSLGLAVPAPLYYDPSGQILPSPYLVIEYIEGQPEFNPTDPIAYAQQAAVHLARIHRADISRLDLSFLPQQPEGIIRTIANWPSQLNSALDEGRIREILQAAWPIPLRNTPALLHGDYWPGNLLWQGDQLAAVIDWEDAALGDPLADLAIARLDLAWIFGQEAMRTFTEHYLSRNNIDLTFLPYWDLCAALRLVRLAGADLAEWAAFFHPYGRTDITEQSIPVQYRYFVEQAMNHLTNLGSQSPG